MNLDLVLGEDKLKYIGIILLLVYSVSLSII